MNAVEFLKKIDGKIKILFHVDADGACSAALVLKLLKQNGKNAELTSAKVEKKEIQKTLDDDFDYAILLDLNVDCFPELFEKNPEKFLLVDHHPIFNDLNKKGIIHVNPRLEDPDVYVSASQVIFDICKQAGLENSEWIRNIGAAGDHAIEGSEEEKQAAELLTAARSIKGQESLPGIAKFLSECKKIDEFLYSDYRESLDIYRKEIENQVRKYEDQGIEEINWFELKSNYSLIGALANELLERFPDKTSMIYRKGSDGVIRLSGRSKKYNLGKIFRKAAEGIGSGGGHPVGAGASFKEKDFELFKKRVLELISSSQ